jgi:hypothetical protein
MQDGDRILMRDGKDSSQPFLSFDRAVWAQFVTEIQNGRYASL